jgi:hypothetical protein
MVVLFLPNFLHWTWVYCCKLAKTNHSLKMFGQFVFEAFTIFAFWVRAMVARGMDSNQLTQSRLIVCLLSFAWSGLYIVGDFGVHFGSHCLARDFGPPTGNDNVKKSAASMLHLWKGVHQLFFAVPVFLISCLETIDSGGGMIRVFDGLLAILSCISVLMFWVEGVQLYMSSFPAPSHLHAPETLLEIRRVQQTETRKVFISFMAQLLFHLLTTVLVFTELRGSSLATMSWVLFLKSFFVLVGVFVYLLTCLCWFCRFGHYDIDDFEHAMWRKRLRVLLGTHNIVSDVFLGGVYVTEGILHLRVPPLIIGAVLLLMCTVNVVVYRSEIATILKRQARTVWRGGSANFLCFAFQQCAYDSRRGFFFLATCVLRLFVLSFLACASPLLRWKHGKAKAGSVGNKFTKPKVVCVTAHSIALEWDLSSTTFNDIGIPGFVRYISDYAGEGYKTTYSVLVSQAGQASFHKVYSGHHREFTMTKCVSSNVDSPLSPATPYFLKVEARIPILNDVVCSEVAEYCTIEPYPDPPDQPRVAGIISHRAAHIGWSSPCTYGNGHPTLEDADGDMWEEFQEQDGTRFWVSFATGNKTHIDPQLRMPSPHLFTLYCKPITSTLDWDDWRIVFRGGKCDYEVGGDTNTSSAISVELRPSTTYIFEVLSQLVCRLLLLPVSHCFTRTLSLSLSLFVALLVQVLFKTACTYWRISTSFFSHVVCQVSASNTHGEGRRSAPRTITTLDAPVEATLPPGWVECWDVSSEFCYYFNTVTKENQWNHPGGVMINDPNLSFRKKRFRLLHLLKRKYPAPEGYAVLPLDIRRTHILQDSFRQLHCKSVSQLALRTKITFEGENVRARCVWI